MGIWRQFMGIRRSSVGAQFIAPELMSRNTSATAQYLDN